MSESRADVVVAGVRKSFGSRAVLRGLDLEVPAGTLTAVLGPSGCGKTTLLRVVAGFARPDAGTVHIGGQQVTGRRGGEVPAHRRRVGLMPQEGALFPHLSVGGNIAFGLDRSRRSESDAVVRHWLEVVGLGGLADARPHELSGGQQQRVALARALAAEPRVLLLDEPFAALDAGLRLRVREDIADILRIAGTTALLVTHDQSEALSLADSVALLIDGVVAQHGPPGDLYALPATLAAARFLGTTVELTGVAEAGTVRTVLGRHPVRIPAADGPVVVVLRPEQVRIVDGRHAADTDGVVTARHFYGAQTSLRVALRDGTTIALRGTSPTLPDVGAQVRVAVDDGVLAYPLADAPVRARSWNPETPQPRTGQAP